MVRKVLREIRNDRGDVIQTQEEDERMSKGRTTDVAKKQIFSEASGRQEGRSIDGQPITGQKVEVRDTGAKAAREEQGLGNANANEKIASNTNKDDNDAKKKAASAKFKQ